MFYLKSQDEYPSGMECWSKLSKLAMELALNKQTSSAQHQKPSPVRAPVPVRVGKLSCRCHDDFFLCWESMKFWCGFNSRLLSLVTLRIQKILKIFFVFFFLITYSYLQSKQFNFLLKFCRHYFSPPNTFTRKGTDPEPDPDP